MSDEKIKQANNNKERQETYARQLARYKKAMKEEFYFEAMLIVYSMMEDRLKSILFYAGVCQNRTDNKISSITKSQINEIYRQKFDDGSQIKLSTITGKMKLISSFIDWEINTEQVEKDDVYLYELKTLMEDLDVGGILETFEKMSDWLRYRNEIIHASMNKNIDALYENLGENVSKGMEYARFLDDQEKIMKKSNRVRKALGFKDK